MRFQLTRIEKLDAQYPGLADDVRKWFTQGIFAKDIPALIFEKYRLSITRSPIGFFRTHCWVPEQALLREKRIAALAAMEVAQQQEVKASMAYPVPGEAK